MQVAAGGSTDSSSSAKASKSSFNAREVDASEYEPQVVELAESRSSHGEDGGTTGSSRGGIGSSSSDSEDSSEDSRVSSSSSSSEEQTAEEKSASNRKAGEGSADNVQELTDKERDQLWIKKLEEMRQRYLASMTEMEREDFFKSLEV